jgi:pSer/pThr/pTyr-binding forkhead associated (FHA) protein
MGFAMCAQGKLAGGMTMATRVTFTVVQGEPLGREFVFSDPARGAVGRSGDCLIRLPNDLQHLNVSRHHCLVEIDPPRVDVRDLGSRNGTYINGEKIGQRPTDEVCVNSEGLHFPSVRLHEGDEIRIGDTVLRITTAAWDEEVDGEVADRELAAAVPFD